MQKRKIKNHNTDATNVGTGAGNAHSGQNYADHVVFGSKNGHGFAAEKANHLFDQSMGKDASIIGSDNVKNGADRLVNGKFIQSKYCATGAKCVNECFDELGNFRYWHSNGKPMHIEVPSDQYNASVRQMQKHIINGKVRGITDPEQAQEIILKGECSYKQACLIAKAGTIEGLTYDAVNGIRLAGTSAGLSAAVTFAVVLWNGEDFEAALHAACYSGFKVGGVAWVTNLISVQIGRTGLEQSLRTTSDLLVRKIGAKRASQIANAIRGGNAVSGAAAMNNLSKLLRGNIVSSVITTLVLSSSDLYKMFNGRISRRQVDKNVTTTAAGVAGGATWMASGSNNRYLHWCCCTTSKLMHVKLWED